MKKILIFTIIVGIASLLFASFSQSSTKSYYSGDALAYQNNLYVSTTNTGSLELFLLKSDKLERLVKIKPFDQRFGRNGSFYDSFLKIESGNLYVYTITDYSIYKYQLVGSELKLVNSVRNSFWEWYNRVDQIGDSLVTISNKGIKVWNKDLLTIDGFDFGASKVPYNVRGNDRFFVNIENSKLYIYDKESRKTVKEIALNFKVDPSAHKIYLDENNNIYVADDYYAKKISLEGKLLGSFKHLDHEAYDVAASGHGDNIYFSNGIGVVRLDKKNMLAKDWAWTNTIAAPRGWAMGLEVVYLNGDKLVVFNNSNILVLNDKLEKIAAFLADEEDDSVYATENLFLNLDKNRAPGNSQVSLNGGGFFPNEELMIDFAGTKTKKKADNRGRFQLLLNVPSLTAKGYDIKVDGADSKLTYSIAFTIE